MRHSADYLHRMLKQIAANQPRDYDDETNARRVASHLQRFWAPTMVSDVQQLPGDSLDPVCQRALQLLQESS